MKTPITMRSLLAEKTDRQVLNTLRGLHVGVKNGDCPRISGSMWTIGSTSPTLEWVKEVRESIDFIDRIESLMNFDKCWLDRPLGQHSNWTKKFGPEFVKAAYIGVSN